MKRYIISSSKKRSNRQPHKVNKGFLAAKKFKQLYPKAYEVLGR